MSPRGAKIDVAVTANLHAAGLLTEKRSFVSLDGHLYLEGADKSRIRPLIFKRFKNRCVICNAKLDQNAEPFASNCGAWHHRLRCDCVGCGELRCDETTGRKCHAHRTGGFNRDAAKQKAAEDFNKLYPEAT